MVGRLRGSAGFTLLEVMVASAVFLIILAALSGSMVYLVRLQGALSSRSQLESAASMAISRMIQGGPERPGVVAAQVLLLEPDKLRFQTEAGATAPIYEYSRNDSGQLVFTVNGDDPSAMVDHVTGLAVEQLQLATGHTLVRVTVELTLPLPYGITTWSLTAEGLPRNIPPSPPPAGG